MKENIEIRRVAELRASNEDRTISGSPIVFNSESVLLDDLFTEIIKPEAVTPELLSKSDIIMLVNHEDDQVPLARSKRGKGTLGVSLSKTGVDISFAARQTPQGDEILAAVRAGDMDGMSFAFTVAEGGDSWVQKSDGTYLRTITKFESIRDFSIVSSPAYTAASCRSLDKFKAEQRDAPPVVEPAVVVQPIIVELTTEVVGPEPLSPELIAYYAPFEASIAELSK